MTAAAQLDRIAAVVPPNRVRIYSLDRAFELVFWLCSEHLAARKADRWQVRSTKEPPWPIACQDCAREAQR